MSALTYKQAHNLVVDYIKVCRHSPELINGYVPNYHIADTFRHLLKYLELEDMYPYEFHVEHTGTGEGYSEEKGHYTSTWTEKSDYHILDKIPEYFDKKLLLENNINEVHRVYQKLRDKDDYIRNILKLVEISLSDIVMPHISDNTLKSSKIKIK